MAYDTAPSRRFAYDADGTVGMVVREDGTGMESISAANLAKMNDESENGSLLEMAESQYGTPWWVCLIFPELREIDGIFYSWDDDAESGTAGKPSIVETSADTTNGIDGTWTQRAADLPDYHITALNYRDEITSLAASGVKGIRVQVTSHAGTYDARTLAMHVYGTFTPAETPDRLVFLDTENADEVFVLPIDYEDVSQGQIQTRTFKIKNNSSTYDFTSVQITAEDLYGAFGDYFTFCDTVDGTYQATLDIGTLTSGSEQEIWAKQTVVDAAPLGLWAGRIKASFGTMV